MRLEEADPRGLIREAYRIEGISPEECRTIFLDWALSLGPESDMKRAIKRVIAAYGGVDHPMGAILRAGLDAPASTGRRGGRRARLGS